MLYAWIYVAAVALLDDANESGEAWRAEMVSRQAAASEDLDVYALLDQGAEDH